MQKTTSSRQKRGLSLSFKLNLLIAAIVLIVSVLLINITYHAYTETAYTRIHEQLDTVSLEQIREDPELLIQCTALYGMTQCDGFAEARAGSVAEEDNTQLYVWLNQFWIRYDTGDYLSNPEHEAIWIELSDKAIEAGCSPEVVMEWILENERWFWMYNGALNFYYHVAQIFIDEADATGFSHVRLYAEDETGLMLLVDSIPTVQQDETYDKLMNYGGYVDRAPPVDACKEQPEQNYVSYETDEGPETAKVIAVDVTTAEGKTARLYFAYCCDTAKVEESRSDFLLRCLLMVALLVAAAIVVSLLLLRRMATKPLRQLADAVNDIGIGREGGGQRELAELDIRSKDEIGVLYRNIRSMQNRILEDADSLTRMTAEKERISTELDLATRIQTDMLPNIFPAFPQRKDFDIYATMDPAKEVGGDFYDFFLVDEDHLALVIADVSGKGVPAALFMMISKIMVQDRTKNGLSPAMVLEQVNEAILVNNREDMFVSVWVGILELSTGRLTAANAGHEYPYLMQPGAGFTRFKDPHGLVIGSLPDIKYTNYELQLRPGSRIFVYTDGVPEATNAELELFGSDRLEAALNECAEDSPEEILRHVRRAVDAFVGEAEQFDDLTMLCLEYRGPQPADR